MPDLEFYTTPKCNLTCSYCYQGRGTQEAEAMYREMYRHKPLDPAKVEKVVKKHSTPGDFVSFTGGEPLLNPEWIGEVMDRTQHLGVRYAIYTNGIMLSRTPLELLQRLTQIQISLDGPEHIHDKVRGVGNFQRALDSMKLVEPHLPETIFLARMTVGVQVNLYGAVMGLLPHFRHIYWQFENHPTNLDEFDPGARWQQLDRLIDEWEKRLRTPERVMLTPLDMAICSLQDRRGGNPKGGSCKAGWDYFSVFNDGKIYDCPEHITQLYAQVGTVAENEITPHLLGDTPATKNLPCLSCPAFETCGCRCIHFVEEPYCEVIRRFDLRMREVHRRVWDVDFEVPINVEAMF